METCMCHVPNHQLDFAPTRKANPQGKSQRAKPPCSSHTPLKNQ